MSTLKKIARERVLALPPVVYACGFSIWKKPIVRRFFADTRVCFVRSATAVPAGNTLIVWGRKAIPGKLAQGVQLIRLEDGFLRSVGLGADLIRPISWVLDCSGIYYDATQVSDLEALLQNSTFNAELLARAARLRVRIVSAKLTKYNVVGGSWQRPDRRAQQGQSIAASPAVQQLVILVPGQVESDASLRYGAPGIATNLALLQAVRAAHPDAYVVYKPHPDVLVGLKAQGVGESDVSAWCDEVVGDVAIGDLLPLVDEVHVLTSLAGYEALLRGKAVTCYGQPFYAGWGLTRDMLPVARRTRQLSLDELVAGVLILYPTYVSYVDSGFITPEQALDELLAWRERMPRATPWWRKVTRWILRRVVG